MNIEYKSFWAFMATKDDPDCRAELYSAFNWFRRAEETADNAILHIDALPDCELGYLYIMGLSQAALRQGRCIKEGFSSQTFDINLPEDVDFQANGIEIERPEQCGLLGVPKWARAVHAETGMSVTCSDFHARNSRIASICLYARINANPAIVGYWEKPKPNKIRANRTCPRCGFPDRDKRKTFTSVT